MHVMCHMRRRIHACHVSYEEEDTCMSAKEEVYKSIYVLYYINLKINIWYIHIYIYIIYISYIYIYIRTI